MILSSETKHLDSAKVTRALISVSDKTGIVEFARELAALNIELLSTGGTYKLLTDNHVGVTEVSEYTGFPEMMAGRVKTLHPKIHGGILGRRGIDDGVMDEHGIKPIDMVIVNLYPFTEAIKGDTCSLEDAIENIDIGGPTMVRSAAKNFNNVAIVVSSTRYAEILSELKSTQGQLTRKTRFDLAVQAFEHTAAYDGAIANYLGTKVSEEHTQFPRTFNMQFVAPTHMRYGENPHQQAAFYLEKDFDGQSVASAEQIQGKALSFNNVADTDAALETVKQFDQPSCVIVKHANPCGVAQAATITEAYELAFQTDPESAFGGIIAFNRELDADTARSIVDKQFVEVIIAPSISDDAKVVVAKKKNIRLLACGAWQSASLTGLDFKRVTGGLLIQSRDAGLIGEDDLKIVSKRQPSEEEIRDLLFAWKVCKMVKSNAIVYALNNYTIGIGAGQMSRVNSARIAGIKAEHAGLEVRGSVMASDAFFPFRDGIDKAGKAGIKAVIQPGGSMRDDETIQAADEHNMAMVFTSMRHFRH